MKLLCAAIAALCLSGCGAAPAWLAVAAPTLSYIASVNNVGSETLKFIDDKDQRSCSLPPQSPISKP